MAALTFSKINPKCRTYARANSLAEIRQLLKYDDLGPLSVGTQIKFGTTHLSAAISVGKVPQCCGMRILSGFSGSWDERTLVILLTAAKRYLRDEADPGQRPGVGALVILNAGQVERLHALTILPALGFKLVFSHVGNADQRLYTFMWHKTGRVGS